MGLLVDELGKEMKTEDVAEEDDTALEADGAEDSFPLL